MKSEKWAQDIMLKYGAMTEDEDLKKGFKKICAPKPGDIVFYKNDEGQFQKVEIVSGQYLDSTYGRLSNFWYWKEIDENGNMSEETLHGYGNFFVHEKNHEEA